MAPSKTIGYLNFMPPYFLKTKSVFLNRSIKRYLAMVAKKEDQKKKSEKEVNYTLNEFDYDGDEVLNEEKEDIEMEYNSDDFESEDEEDFDTDREYGED